MMAFIHGIPSMFILISLAFCIGALVCGLWVFTPSARAEFPNHGILLGRMWRLFGIGIAAIIAGSIAELVMRAMGISGQPFPEVFSVLPAVIFRTHFGRVWLIRGAALILLSIALMAGRRYRDSSGFLFFMLAISVIVSMTESASGHASDKGDFSIPEIVDWLHLFAALVWGGGLFVLSTVILPKIVRPGDHAAQLIAGVASRFSKIAGVAVGIVALTALYHTRVYVGSFEALLKTPYGQVVIAKIFLFFLLLNLGAFNRYISVPFLREMAGFPAGRRGIINRIAVSFFTLFRPDQSGYRIALRFMRSVRVEAFLMVVVLLCVALLRHEIPARHFLHLEYPMIKTSPMTGNGSHHIHNMK